MLELSALAKTWILDVDGTILKHNAYLHGEDILLDGVKDFFEKLNPNDKVVLLTARKEEYKNDLIKFLNLNGIRFDKIIFDMPMGERILINDDKPSGLKCAYAVNKTRDSAFDVKYTINSSL